MGLINQYGKLVTEKPWLVLIVALIFTGAMFYSVTQLQMVGMDYEDILPKGNEVMDAFDFVKNEFGNSDNALIVIEINPSFENSNEPLDIRDPRVINYIDILTQQSQYVDYVESVSSASQLIKVSNQGYIPNTLRSIKNILNNHPFSNQYISEDYSMSLIKINLNEDASNNAEEIEKQLSELIDKTEKPAGVKVQLAGETLKQPILQRATGKDTTKTSLYSIIGIILILFLLFRSIKNTILPLTTILFGIVWALGFTSLIGMGISPVTSGVISMIMGIGIDFGIQIINRFKQELRKYNKEEAMRKTINGVFMPMLTTTIAALIGFRAMSLGELKMMGEMGTIMSLGVAFCMLAAVTIVPSLLVLLEKDKAKK